LTAAISALPAISERGSDIGSAMRALRTNVLSFGWRGYNNYIQKVALTFTDDRATNSRELAAAHQVSLTLRRLSVSLVSFVSSRRGRRRRHIIIIIIIININILYYAKRQQNSNVRYKHAQ